MPKKDRIQLSAEERSFLEGLLRKDSSSAKQQRRARILLLCDEQRAGGPLADACIAEHTQTCVSSVERTRCDLAEQGLETALGRAPSRRCSRRKLDGAAEARLIAECCGPPPEGRVRWTLRLLADRMVELAIVESLSHESVRRVLQANLLKPWLKKQWCLPPKANAAFVCAMEQTLEVYQRARDPRRPLVCLDEASKQLLEESLPSLPMAAGQPARQNYEHIRHGVASYFMLLAPLEGWRHVALTGTRTRLDDARVLKALADEHFQEAEKIVLVQDNLNTHHPSSLYEAYPPAEARRLLERSEFHYMPKHGSWLNMAETELSVLHRQSLDERLGSLAALEQRLAAWQRRRNAEAKSDHRQFTTADARTKLHRFYPSTQA